MVDHWNPLRYVSKLLASLKGSFYLKRIFYLKLLFEIFVIFIYNDTIFILILAQALSNFWHRMKGGAQWHPETTVF